MSGHEFTRCIFDSVDIQKWMSEIDSGQNRDASELARDAVAALQVYVYAAPMNRLDILRFAKRLEKLWLPKKNNEIKTAVALFENPQSRNAAGLLAKLCHIAACGLPKRLKSLIPDWIRWADEHGLETTLAQSFLDNIKESPSR